MAKKTQKNTFTVTLADGTQLAGLELNGNNFISKTEVTEETFRGKLRHVTISGDQEADTEGLISEHENMELIQVQKYKGEFWFVLRDIPADKLKEAKRDSDIAYLSMMTGIDLD